MKVINFFVSGIFFCSFLFYLPVHGSKLPVQRETTSGMMTFFNQLKKAEQNDFKELNLSGVGLHDASMLKNISEENRKKVRVLNLANNNFTDISLLMLTKMFPCCQ